jgi:hypothetical protein
MRITATSDGEVGVFSRCERSKQFSELVNVDEDYVCSLFDGRGVFLSSYVCHDAADLFVVLHGMESGMG